MSLIKEGKTERKEESVDLAKSGILRMTSASYKDTVKITTT